MDFLIVLWITCFDLFVLFIVHLFWTLHRCYYVGTFSLDESLTIEKCCIFRGSFVKLDARSGTILWKTYMLPDNNNTRGDYAGAASWGSSPSIDVYRNHVYIATGNLYSAPLHILECQERQNNQTKPTQPDECIEPVRRLRRVVRCMQQCFKP